MGKLHSALDADLQAWLAAQRMFFVATAPSGDGGHVNCSPKGGDPLRVLGPTTVAYVDRIGSGIETVAHVRQNGRITIMLCAFEGPPRIVRLYGKGEVISAGDPGFAPLLAQFGTGAFGVRTIVRVELSRIADSCGFGVPLLRFEGERELIGKWAEKKGEAGMAAYVREKNGSSIDGLPGIVAG
ncbi:MAG TPA: pyridoxamine 5'-phosphate oxidase family protein [Planctomycetota bacterium]